MSEAHEMLADEDAAERGLRLRGQRVPERAGVGVTKQREEDLLIVRTYEPDDEAISQAVAILLREEAREGEAA